MRTRKAFTLAELIAVATMVGILLAVATPTVMHGTGEVSDRSMRMSLQVVREAIEAHASENGGEYPDAADDAAFKRALKPYLRGILPASPVGSKDNLVKMSTDDLLVADGTTGWMYNGTTGTFILNCAAVSEDGSTRYDEF
jgi:general secretion pathway protein G